MNNTIFIVCAKMSGSGKDSVVNELCKRHNLTKVLSYTTRPQRVNEIGTHTFVDDVTYDTLTNKVGETLYDGYRYCATQEQVEAANFYVLDKAGIEYFKEHYHGKHPVKVIQIVAPQNICEERMKNRGDKKKDISKRIQNDIVMFHGLEKLVDFTVVNIDLDKCVNSVWKYMNK